MSDMADDFRAMRDHRREQRRAHGINCPTCAVKLPRAHPTILLPGQRCRVCGYVDPRGRKQ